MLTSNSPSLSNSDSADNESANDSRRQYTLKGVESEAIELMRLAASAKGMKIGHWVSERLKEAAREALDETELQRDVLNRIVARGSPQVETQRRQIPSHLEDISQQEYRLRSLEMEIKELTKIQRDMMAMLLKVLA